MKRILIIFSVCLGALVLFVVITNVVIWVTTRPFRYVVTEDVPSVQAVLIPGAGIFESGALSSFFLERVDTAIELYQLGTVSKILVSGDNSSVEYNEVNPVRLYLLENRIPDKDIFLDHAGFDTYSSMYRARDIFGVTSLVVSTQSFHLPRSVFIARRLGLEAYGVRAGDGQAPVENYAREVLANEKALFNLVFFRTPKYLGDPIPIEGDGRLSP